MNRSLIVLAISSVLGCVSASGPSAYSDALVVDFSSLVDSPATYDQEIVRVRGTYTVGFEASVLRETERGPQIWVELDSTYPKSTDPKVLRAFRKLLHRREGSEFLDRSARVVVVGRFHGVKPTVEFRGRTLTNGFGHLNAYDFKLTVLAVEVAKWSPW